MKVWAVLGWNDGNGESRVLALRSTLALAVLFVTSRSESEHDPARVLDIFEEKGEYEQLGWFLDEDNNCHRMTIQKVTDVEGLKHG